MERQTQISVVFIMLLSFSVLGQLCPLLLLLAPLWVWTNHCTVIWLKQHDHSASKKVVDKILVQQPTTVFGVVGRISQCAVAVVVFMDLEFRVGPIMLYFVLFVAAEVGTFFWHRRKLESQQVATIAFLVMQISAEFNPVRNNAQLCIYQFAPPTTASPISCFAVATSHHCPTLLLSSAATSLITALFSAFSPVHLQRNTSSSSLETPYKRAS